MNNQEYPGFQRTAKIFLTAVIIFVLTLSVLNSYMLLHPLRRPVTLNPSDLEMSYESVTFQSLDGLNLKGWLIPSSGSSSLIIICHGHGSSKDDVLFASKFLYDKGYNIFLFDFRAHGESEGATATLGWLEPNDLKAAIAYAKNKINPDKIGVIGFSMGGATAITTAGQTSDIQAVVADSAFSDRSKLIIKSVYYPVINYLTLLFAQIQGLNLQENLPIDYAGKISPNALLIIQGDRDHLVDVEDADSLYKKAKDPKDMWIVRDTPHVRAYQLRKQDYERKVLEFFDEYLKTEL